MATDYCTKWVEAKPLRENTAIVTTKFLYEYIWCRFGCPIELISDFLNSVVKELTQHYAVVHKKSTPYFPQANGLVESTNKTLQNILKKIVNENRTYWDTKLYSALWAYQTSYKTSIQSTPFRLAFGLEAFMPVEFQVPSLRIQIRERLPEEQSEHARLQQLLESGEIRVRSMAILEQEQRLRKTLNVDRHRNTREKDFMVGRPVLVFQTRMGQMPGKLRFHWTCPYWIEGAENGTFSLGTLARDILRQKVNGFRLKPYFGPTPPNPFHAIQEAAEKSGH